MFQYLLVASAADAARLRYIVHSVSEGTLHPDSLPRGLLSFFLLFRVLIRRWGMYDCAMSTGKLKLIRIIACVDGNAEVALVMLDGNMNLTLLPSDIWHLSDSIVQPLLGPGCWMQRIAVAGYLELEFSASTLICKTDHTSWVSARRGTERNMPRVALICDIRTVARKRKIGYKVGLRIPRTRVAALYAFNKSCKTLKKSIKDSAALTVEA